MNSRSEWTAGQVGGDFTGSTNTALQAAVNRAAVTGGGVVRILPGVYRMDDSLHLRSGVSVRGSGEDTVLLKPPSRSSPVSCYLGYGHYDVEVTDPGAFSEGGGICIFDDNSGGFYSTVATVCGKNGDTLLLFSMLNADCNPRANGRAVSIYPIVSGCEIVNAELADLRIEGNGSRNERLNGCRGGGVYLLQAHGTRIANVTVREFNGDGISFQACSGTVVDGCDCSDNAGHGMHPGSGSVGAIIRSCACRNNGEDGVFFCLRVTYSALHDCTITGNRGRGVSIGHRDCNLALTRNRIDGNGGAGIYFRPDPWHRTGLDTLIQSNFLHDNGGSDGGQIVFDTSTSGTHVQQNSISCDPERQVPSILLNHPQTDMIISDNQACDMPQGCIDGIIYECLVHTPSAGPSVMPGDADLHLRPHHQEGINVLLNK